MHESYPTHSVSLSLFLGPLTLGVLKGTRFVKVAPIAEAVSARLDRLRTPNQ